MSTKWAPGHKPRLGLPITAAIAILVIIGSFALITEYIACDSRARSFTDSEWGPIQGCMVLHNDRWLPLENMGGFDGN